MNINNVNTLDDTFIDDPQHQSLLKTLYLGEAAGCERLYVNIDVVKPGGKSAKYHSHSKQEEFFLILNGTGTLRMNDEWYNVKKGDFIAKPAGKGIAHQFINDGLEELEILDCGTKDQDDIVTYPDEDVIYIKNIKKAFKASEQIAQWNSSPE